jgi:hypothetical protein
VRFQAHLDAATFQQFTAVKDALGAETHSEVLRRIIALAQHHIQYRREGFRVLLEKNGAARDVDFLF